MSTPNKTKEEHISFQMDLNFLNEALAANAEMILASIELGDKFIKIDMDDTDLYCKIGGCENKFGAICVWFCKNFKKFDMPEMLKKAGELELD